MIREYSVVKFQCGIQKDGKLKQLQSKTIKLEGGVEKARKEGERILKVQPNQFVGAELLPL